MAWKVELDPAAERELGKIDPRPADLGKYRQQWEKLEGREPVRQQEQAKAQKIERDNSPGMSR